MSRLPESFGTTFSSFRNTCSVGTISGGANSRASSIRRPGSSSSSCCAKFAFSRRGSGQSDLKCPISLQLKHLTLVMSNFRCFFCLPRSLLSPRPACVPSARSPRPLRPPLRPQPPPRPRAALLLPAPGDPFLPFISCSRACIINISWSSFPPE